MRFKQGIGCKACYFPMGLAPTCVANFTNLALQKGGANEGFNYILSSK